MAWEGSLSQAHALAMPTAPLPVALPSDPLVSAQDQAQLLSKGSKAVVSTLRAPARLPPLQPKLPHPLPPLPAHLLPEVEAVDLLRILPVRRMSEMVPESSSSPVLA